MQPKPNKPDPKLTPKMQKALDDLRAVTPAVRRRALELFRQKDGRPPPKG
ncbi:MAG: hypothetical protein J0L57_00755 [Burkholderiales bacterium]|nr:hypothetical protein [Burkholderiales bacterium]